MRNPRVRPRPLAGLAAVAAATIALAPPASAQELEIEDVIVTQAVRFPNTPLIAGNVTFVRVLVDTPGTAAPVEGVDAVIRVTVDGQPAAFSPLRSINGPITAPNAPNPLVLDHHLNFWFIGPESADVDLEVFLNPEGAVAGDDPAGNVVLLEDLVFECRREVDVAYVPIDYLGGGGPDESLIEPGIGDAFLRAVFKPGAWNYYASPTGTLAWNQDINGSNGALLNTLRDIRLNQLPALGFLRPEFVYGWLPGNPFNGNGQAIGIPGDVAFGNTDPARHQRTFAHEIGHLLDEVHNGENVGQVGVDVEHLLFRPLGLPQLQSSGRNDVMVAGQLTDTAFVSGATFLQTLGDPRFQCPGVAGAQAAEVPVLRVSGTWWTATRQVDLDPVTWIERAPVDAPRPDAEVLVIARDAAGLELHRTSAVSGRTVMLCSSTPENPRFAEQLPLHVTVPAEVDGRPVHRIEVVDRVTGAVVASRERSANPPATSFTGTSIVGADLGGDGPPRLRVTWSASDPDGDPLEHVLLYGNEAAGWVPLGVRLEDTAFEVALPRLADVPDGRLRLVTTDGLNHRVIDSGPVALPAGGGDPPTLEILTPRGTTAFGRQANIVLHAFSWDLQDRVLDEEISWLSNLEGPLGSGRLIEVRLDTPGIHSIIATATDSDGMTTVRSILVGIEDRPLPDPDGGEPADLDGDGTVGFGDLVILLAAYGPCPGGGDPCPADLDGDGSVGFADVLVLVTSWT